uniref:Si:ch73-132f6.5 n=1 Tax=Oryzias sinensis TaxID=183150 RepID=A0A8C7XZN9_9TELE
SGATGPYHHTSSSVFDSGAFLFFDRDSARRAERSRCLFLGFTHHCSCCCCLSLAGHLIECGAQSTGGIFTDWHRVPDWDVMGFPVVECSPDGSFVLSKPPNTGGLVSFGTVAEQLVYEIGDPRRYLLPDVTCDFSQVVLQEVSDGAAVSVRGARGFPPPNDYKVCATYLDGFRATAVCPVGGPRAAEKARRTADSLIKRTRRLFQLLNLDDFSAVNVQILGAEDTYGHNARHKVRLAGAASPESCSLTTSSRVLQVNVSHFHPEGNLLWVFTSAEIWTTLFLIQEDVSALKIPEVCRFVAMIFILIFDDCFPKPDPTLTGRFLTEALKSKSQQQITKITMKIEKSKTNQRNSFTYN